MGTTIEWLVIWFFSPKLGEFARAWEIEKAPGSAGRMYRTLLSMHGEGKLPAPMNQADIIDNHIMSTMPLHCVVINVRR